MKRPRRALGGGRKHTSLHNVRNVEALCESVSSHSLPQENWRGAANRTREPGRADRLPQAEVDPFSRRGKVVPGALPASRARRLYRTGGFLKRPELTRLTSVDLPASG
jgi:hypothetical protein